MEKKSMALIVLVIILSLFVIKLGRDVVNYKNINNNVINDNEEENIFNNYQIFADNLKSQIAKYDVNNKNYQYIKNNFVKDGYEIYLNEQGSLFVKYFNKELNDKYGDYKIADNVLSFYTINVGQDVGNMLYFINEDGTVGSADTEYGIGTNDQIIINKNIGYKNIVSIVNGNFGNSYSGVHGPIFIDINGNIFCKNLD